MVCNRPEKIFLAPTYLYVRRCSALIEWVSARVGIYENEIAEKNGKKDRTKENKIRFGLRKEDMK